MRVFTIIKLGKYIPHIAVFSKNKWIKCRFIKMKTIHKMMSKKKTTWEIIYDIQINIYEYTTKGDL